jgi:hypothetical protein
MTKQNAAAGAIKCDDCENDLNMSQKKEKKDKKQKKHRKHKHRSKKAESPESEHDEDSEIKDPKVSRQRRVILDSDDEDEEGEWIVPKDQQDVSELGKAGGIDDENADGGGDTLGSVDSASFATVDSSAEKEDNDSFIVHDTDEEDDVPALPRKNIKEKVIDLVSDDEEDSGPDSQGEESDTESGSDTEESDTESDSDIEYGADILTPSTKIRQLLQILEKETPDHKVIVFSQFTSMLDLVEPFLRRHDYEYTRYDGKMRNDMREASLDKLRNNKRTRVLLCSLKCGSLGLNLTAASRVVIMEPFWNPVSLEIGKVRGPL